MFSSLNPPYGPSKSLQILLLSSYFPLQNLMIWQATRDIISKLFCLIFKVLLPISYKCLPNSAPRAFIFLNYFNQSIVDLQCCAKFCCIAKLPSYAHIRILFHYSLSQESFTLSPKTLDSHHVCPFVKHSLSTKCLYCLPLLIPSGSPPPHSFLIIHIFLSQQISHCRVCGFLKNFSLVVGIYHFHLTSLILNSQGKG